MIMIFINIQNTFQVRRSRSLYKCYLRQTSDHRCPSWTTSSTWFLKRNISWTTSAVKTFSDLNITWFILRNKYPFSIFMIPSIIITSAVLESSPGPTQSHPWTSLLSEPRVQSSPLPLGSWTSRGRISGWRTNRRRWKTRETLQPSFRANKNMFPIFAWSQLYNDYLKE